MLCVPRVDILINKILSLYVTDVYFVYSDLGTVLFYAILTDLLILALFSNINDSDTTY